LHHCKAIYERLTDCISLTTPCSRQHGDLISYIAVTGGLLWILRSRSIARKPFEEKQEKIEDTIDRHPDPTMGRSKPERDLHTRP
jgi:hypothetical protein